MSWPETTITSRLLAGAVACVLSAILGFILAYAVLSPHAPLSAVGYWVVFFALIGFGLGFWKGDPAVRGVARIFRGL